jgi:hypothetical protein
VFIRWEAGRPAELARAREQYVSLAEIENTALRPICRFTGRAGERCEVSVSQLRFDVATYRIKIRGVSAFAYFLCSRNGIL